MPWRPIDTLPHVRTEYEFAMPDGSVVRGVMHPNGDFTSMDGEDIPRPRAFWVDPVQGTTDELWTFLGQK